jgi:DNA modification methylase
MVFRSKQDVLPLFNVEQDISVKSDREANILLNRLSLSDRRFHDWFRFVLAYPPGLVRDYISNFNLSVGATILDPFCGTGTTLVESKLLGINSVGLEANPFAHFASSVKIDWDINPDILESHANEVASKASKILNGQGFSDFSPFSGDITSVDLKSLPTDIDQLLLTNSISPLPLHKVLVLMDCLEQNKDARIYNHEQLALANALVTSISNLKFGPEVGVGKLKKDAPVILNWLAEINKMVDDLRVAQGAQYPPATAIFGDAREVSNKLAPASIDAVITSPPYPNEKDYTRTTRLESVLLGFIKSKSDLRNLKQNLLRSNTRGVYKNDQDYLYVANHPEIQRIANEIEKRRLEMGKTSGFEKQYSKVTQEYFGGMVHHLSEMRSVLRPGARLAYVVGDQASYLRVMIRTGQILGDLAEQLGYKLERIDLFRTRFSTATKEQLREEVVILSWPGAKDYHGRP